MIPIRIAQFGLDPIGLEALRLAATKPWLRIVGGVDIDPKKVGRSIGELTGLASLDAPAVFPSVAELWHHAQPDVILHTAGSRAVAFFEQMREVVSRGASVASTCEELIYPSLLAAELSQEFDALCQQHGARVVGTGVNPGFVMDLMPAFLAGVAREVHGVSVRRVVNASTRRQPLQAKIGSGMEPEEFRRRFNDGRAGHAGFRQSVSLIAHVFGWALDEIVETCEPVIADRPVRTGFFEVAPGLTRGLHQIAIGRSQGRERIVLDLTMALDEPDPHDHVRLESRPPLQLTLNGGVAGDDATVAALINAIPRLLAAQPGLRLLSELPVAAPPQSSA